MCFMDTAGSANPSWIRPRAWSRATGSKSCCHLSPETDGKGLPAPAAKLVEDEGQVLRSQRNLLAELTFGGFGFYDSDLLKGSITGIVVAYDYVKLRIGAPEDTL